MKKQAEGTAPWDARSSSAVRRVLRAKTGAEVKATARPRRSARVGASIMLGVAALGIVIWQLRLRPTPQQSVLSPDDVVTKGIVEQGPGPQEGWGGTPEPHSDEIQPNAGRDLTAKNPTLAISPSSRSFGELRTQVFATRPALAEFKRLQEKVLRSAEENAAAMKLLSDPKLISEAQQDLRGSGERELDEAAQLRRMYQVDYLMACSAWKDNPERTRAIEAIKDAVMSEGLHEGAPENLRKSLAGDKIELYSALKQLDETESAKIRLWSRGRSLEPLLAHADRTALRSSRVSRTDVGGTSSVQDGNEVAQ